MTDAGKITVAVTPDTTGFKAALTEQLATALEEIAATLRVKRAGQHVEIVFADGVRLTVLGERATWSE